MNTGRTVFAQLMDFLPRQAFRQCVRRYKGQHKVKTFSCPDQHLAISFAQLPDASLWAISRPFLPARRLSVSLEPLP